MEVDTDLEVTMGTPKKTVVKRRRKLDFSQFEHSDKPLWFKRISYDIYTITI